MWFRTYWHDILYNSNFQFLLGYFYYNEPFSITKLVSFIFIWIAVIIYLKDLHETN